MIQVVCLKTDKIYRLFCDTSHYEKIDGPFEIPESWEWCRVADIANSILYGVSESAKPNGRYKLLRITDIQENKVDWNSVPFTNYDEEDARKYLLNNGDILFARTGATVGKSYLVADITLDSIYASYLIRIQTSKNVSPEYFKRFFESGYYWEQISSSSVGVGQPNVNGTSLANLLIPIPPFDEQKRIVLESEKWFSLIESIEKESDCLSLNIERAKSFILNFAITGKLVPQAPSDEPAIELLKRINPDFRPCDNSQYPYDIPGSWQFATLGEVTSFLSRGKSPKYSEERKYPVFAQKCNQWEGITLEKVQFLEPSTLQKWPDEYKLQDGDVLINSTGTGTLGRTGIFYKNILGGYPFILPDSHVTVVRGNKEILSQEYLFLISRSLYMQKWMIDNMVGSTNQKELYPKALEGFMLAIPPRAEQDRIVSYVKRVIDKVESLVQNI